MRYVDAMQKIQTGDLIAVRRRSGPLAVLTRIITKNPYTHTGLAIWAGGRLLMAHVIGTGTAFVPVAYESEYGFDVYACPVDRDRVEAHIWNTIGEKKLEYSVYDLLRCALYIVFRIPLPKQGTDYICSALSGYIYRLAGWNPPNVPAIPWPGAIVKALGTEPIAEVRG